MIRVIGRREIFEILFMFLAVQIIGVLIVAAMQGTIGISGFQAQIVSPQSVYLSYVLDTVLIITILLLLLNRHNQHTVLVHHTELHDAKSKEQHISHHALHGNMTFLALEAIVVIATSFFFFLAVFDIILMPIPFQYIFVLSLLAAIILIAAKDVDHKIRNTVTMVSSIGVGLLLGIYFSFELALIGLAIVSVYDYTAVFVTKSMIKLAKAVTKNDMAFMISSTHLESEPIGDFPQKEARAYEKYLHDSRRDEDPRFARLLSAGRLPVMSQLQLGEGDLGLPLMAAIAAYIAYQSYIVAFAVIIGAAIGLLVTIKILEKYRHPLPAIPPLFAFMGIASFLALAFTGNFPYYNPVILGTLIFGVASFILVLLYVRHKEKRESEEM